MVASLKQLMLLLLVVSSDELGKNHLYIVSLQQWFIYTYPLNSKHKQLVHHLTLYHTIFISHLIVGKLYTHSRVSYFRLIPMNLQSGCILGKSLATFIGLILKVCDSLVIVSVGLNFPCLSIHIYVCMHTQYAVYSYKFSYKNEKEQQMYKFSVHF